MVTPAATPAWVLNPLAPEPGWTTGPRAGRDDLHSGSEAAPSGNVSPSATGPPVSPDLRHCAGPPTAGGHGVSPRSGSRVGLISDWRPGGVARSRLVRLGSRARGPTHVTRSSVSPHGVTTGYLWRLRHLVDERDRDPDDVDADAGQRNAARSGTAAGGGAVDADLSSNGA